MRKLLALTFALLLAGPALSQSIGPNVVQIRPAGSGGPSIDDLAAYALGKTTAQVPYVYNLNPGNSSHLKIALASRNAIVANYGDSVERGVDETSVPYNAQYTNSWPQRAAALLSAAGIPAGSNNWYGLSGSSLNDYLIRDARVSASGAAILGSNQVAGGTEIRFNGAVGTFTFTSQNFVDTAQIVWGDQVTTGRCFSWAVDGGSATNICTSGTANIVSTSISLGGLGLHTITFSWVSGTALLYGVNTYNSQRFEVQFWQQSASGFQSANLVSDVGTPGAGRLTQISKFCPDLAIAEMGVNDYRNNVTVATFKTNMQTWINYIQTNCPSTDIMLKTFPYDNSNLGLVLQQNLWVGALYQLALSNNIALIDMRARWPSYNYAVRQGWQVVTDGVHPTTNATGGHADEAANIIVPLITYILTH